MTDAIVAKNIHKRFGRAKALVNVSLIIPRGSVYCIAGPNGSGKTTLLEILSGGLSPDNGTIVSEGTIGYCRQNPLLYEDLTVSQNIELFSDILCADRGVVDEMAEVLELGMEMKKRVMDLSSGTKKRVELCIAVMSGPDILILDEPTTGLDRRSSDRMISFIRGIRKEGTVVIATHLLHEFEGLCSHLLVLKEGEKVYEKGNVKNLENVYKKIMG
ncbi:MAG: ABC transporter ATP-binding protein [Candidatus Micrarchaeota archaeon]